MLIDTPDLPKISGLAAQINVSTEEAFNLTSLSGAFEEIIESGEPQLYLKRDIRQMIDDPLHVTPGDVNLIEIFSTKLAAMYIYTLTPEQLHERDVIWSAPNSYLFSLLTRSEEVLLEKYVYPPEWTPDVYDEQIKLMPTGKQLIEPGRVYSVARETDAIRLTIEKPIALIKLIDMRGFDYQWMFDAPTLSPRLICAATPQQSRVDMLIDIANEFHNHGYVRKEIAALFENLCKHPLHHIRWKAVQSLYRVSKPLGRDALSKALSDKNPHVAKAAAKSMARLNKSVGVPTS